MTVNTPLENSAPTDRRALHRTLTDALRHCVIVDCETTGLDPDTDSIIEVAALRVRDGRPVALFHRLVDPHRPLPGIVTDLTGLRTGDLTGAPEEQEMMEDLLPFLRDDTVVGHHVAFDIGFLASSSPPSSLFPSSSLCTAETARQLIPRSRVLRYRLSTLSDVLGLAHRPTHRTIDDVLATLDLLQALRDIAGTD